MDPNLSEWLNLFLRWAHVFAGILWIGSTYLFTWLDHRLSETQDGVWMVHSGGFYVVQKQTAPSLRPQKLHWFKWEAFFTWLSGILLLILVFYMGGGALIDETVAKLSAGQVIGIGVGLLIAAWVVYDLLWVSPLGKHPPVALGISIAALLGVVYGLTHLMSGRGAYIHVGAMFGTIMAANVWMRILPAQRQLVAALETERPINSELAARAKLRSKHNTYMVVPVVFIMLSNHFPSASYGSDHNALVLCGLIAAGWVAAHFLRR